MPYKGWKTITIREDVYQKLERYLETNEEALSEMKVETTSDLIDLAFENLPNKVKPRFEHFNVCEDHATILDRQLGNRLINVYIKDHKLWCELDESYGCIHVGYAYSIPKVQMALSGK